MLAVLVLRRAAMDDEVEVERLLPRAHTRAPEGGEVLVGPERRRRWSTEEKLRILAQSVAPGSSPSLACRLNGISSGQLYTWRRQFRTGELTGFVPVSVAPDVLPPPSPEPVAPSAIEVELPSGVKLRVSGGVNEAALRRVLSALS